MDNLQVISFEGNVKDFKALLNAVNFALTFTQTANSSFYRNESEKKVRMDFNISGNSTDVYLKVLDTD